MLSLLGDYFLRLEDAVAVVVEQDARPTPLPETLCDTTGRPRLSNVTTISDSVLSAGVTRSTLNPGSRRDRRTGRERPLLRTFLETWG